MLHPVVTPVRSVLRLLVIPVAASACALLLPGLAAAQGHLLLTEVVLQPSQAEFIEIDNPTSGEIDLDDYYLADNSSYALIPRGPGTVDPGDFIVRFPSGASIRAGQTLVVAMGGVDFATTYASDPAFEIISQTPLVPDMRIVAVSGAPNLTNAGEGIVLFRWDGASDLVEDVDMVNAGVPSAGNRIAAKTNVSVDGPDGDSSPTFYRPDAATMPLQATSPGAGRSTKRIAFEPGHELTSDGNGLAGHDETSEDISVTWDQAYTAPDPGLGLASLGVGDARIPSASGLRCSNPVRGRVRIERFGAWTARPASIRLHSVSGQRVFAGRWDSSGPIWPAVDLAPGLYWVHVSDGVHAASAKFVVLSPR